MESDFHNYKEFNAKGRVTTTTTTTKKTRKINGTLAKKQNFETRETKLKV